MLDNDSAAMMTHHPLGKGRLYTVASAYDDVYEGAFTHEFGHHFSIFDKGTLQRADEYLAEGKKLIEENVSKYASSNSAEVVAECYALWQHPQFDTMSDTTRDIVRNVLGAQ